MGAPLKQVPALVAEVRPDEIPFFQKSKKYNSRFNITDDEKRMLVLSTGYGNFMNRMINYHGKNIDGTRVTSLWSQRAYTIDCIDVDALMKIHSFKLIAAKAALSSRNDHKADPRSTPDLETLVAKLLNEQKLTNTILGEIAAALKK